MSANVIAGPQVFSTGSLEYSGKAVDGVVHVPGVRYGERLDAADRFSPLRDPSPGRAQAGSTVFPQSPGSLDWLMGPALSSLEQDEDSFLLDIWTPEGALDLPVLVFLPGGAFISGAGNVGWYDGARLAAEGNAVVVTVSYRLGALALLGGSGVPLNLGVQDILQALTWISANISAFGGDPAAVTLAGHSAGAWYAYVLSLAPAAKGLFCRTALFSLPWQPPLSPAAYAERRELFNGFLKDALDGGTPDGALDGGSLATAPVPAILEAQAAVGKAYAGRGLGLVPAADGGLVPDWAMDFRRAASSLHVESLLLSSTDNEAAAFLHPVPVAAVSPEQVAGFVAGHFEEAPEVLDFLDSRIPDATPHAKLVEAMSLHQFRLAATELAGRANAAGVEATLLRFSVPSKLDGVGSPHCFELPFLFGNREDWRDAPMLRGFPEDSFEAVSGQLRSLLLSFVANGRPRSADGEPLDRFTADHPQLHALAADGVVAGTIEPELRARR
ncbi:carboxylesterase family protein [Arthrobacter sp. ISL-65]|uniref:carboxylesterase family protein n=1 Tax=Arthrobacter sp. ISL-65 TaxID=2819112 RepID=UPI001BE73BA9|nr:carboxylesterase family protein [Arthrobacter sp. ISL-65]MBT2548125.1 carboxylesterase/lipase family protein [Arthrobacter sp. ISL-65]